MDKEAKEVLAFIAGIMFLVLIFIKLATIVFHIPTPTIDIKNEIVELKKQREMLGEIKKQNEEIIKLLKK